MQWSEALAVLGLAEAADERSVRSAFRSRLRDTHPDLNAASDATERTVRLTTAYRVVLERLSTPEGDGHGAGPAQGQGRGPADGGAAPTADQGTGAATTDQEPRPRPSAADDDLGPGAEAVLVDAETIGIPAPAVEVVPLLIEAAHRLGDITYLDPGAGLLEVVVEFVGAPTSSVVLSLQGRAATGLTEVFCSVEPLSGGEAPSAEAVTQLLHRTLLGQDPTA
jgi:hypothetical protein